VKASKHAFGRAGTPEQGGGTGLVGPLLSGFGTAVGAGAMATTSELAERRSSPARNGNIRLTSAITAISAGRLSVVSIGQTSSPFRPTAHHTRPVPSTSSNFAFGAVPLEILARSP